MSLVRVVEIIVFRKKFLVRRIVFRFVVEFEVVEVFEI